ncbi:MAG: SDR family oxidoreductase [Pseudomonas sp.]|uniref:SDR family oxidoreductase n=1 Tax=Pseudomonas abieticivorans TaxID=2931382 RepID=UPI0020BD855A|nr:SDR family oxidoreductase [Pseudomonas sp. PIA16]MDE1164229.1 SDR family oxidoreductase [Pseudomonas sp.]
MKRIVIIGATSAIAAACARLWATQGSEFYLVGRNEEKLHQTGSDLLGRGAKNVHYHVLDVTDYSRHAALLQSAADTLKQIDVLLVAHGTLPDQNACEQNVETALAEFSANGTSVISLLTHFSNHFEHQRCGTIAVISSVAGDRGRQSNYLYGTAKSAVSTFCQGLRVRMFKVGVHVVDIKPGFVDTPMTKGLPLPGPLVAKPETVAALILRGIERRKAVVYAPSFWRLIMLIIKSVPDFVFKRLSL